MLIQRLREDHREMSVYDGDGSIQLDWYFRSTSRLPVTAMRYELAPGVSEGEHFHATGHPESCTVEGVDELYLVTRGELVVTTDGERAVLHAGDAMYAPVGAVHGVVNESDQTAEFVLIFGKPAT